MIKCLLPQKEDSNRRGWGGEHSPEKRVRGCATLTTFSRRLQDPQLRLKSVYKILIWKINVKFCLQNQHFSENKATFSSRSSNLSPILVKKLRNLINYQFSNPCFWWKSAHKPLTFTQFIRTQAPTFTAIYSHTSPQIRKSGPHIPMRKKGPGGYLP